MMIVCLWILTTQAGRRVFAPVVSKNVLSNMACSLTFGLVTTVLFGPNVLTFLLRGFQGRDDLHVVYLVHWTFKRCRTIDVVSLVWFGLV
jgi:hypothetical protein